MIEELAPKYGYKPREIKIDIIGTRPGEKLYELLMTEEEAQHVEDRGDMFVLKPAIVSPHVVTKETIRKPLEPKEYISKCTKLLTKDGIRKVLREEKIV
jgi:FlaA1/EpsC-like NDP-sugar epimerase